MQSEELAALVQKIQRLGCETQQIELKSANKGTPTRLYDTLSGFSNQDDGGVIIFGIDEETNFSVVGVYDAQDLQKKVTEQCKQMEPVVWPLFSVALIDEKIIVSAEIPGVDISDRPVFYRGVGRVKGSYIRVGESDEPMSEYEIYSYDAFRKRIRDDLRQVVTAKTNLFNEELLSKYINRVKQERKNLSQNVSDAEILELMGVLSDGVPTLSGVITFSKYPQGYFPQFCITAVALPGLQMGELGGEGERFLDNQRITGAVPEMLAQAVDFVRKNSRISTIIDENGKRNDKAEYPLKAVREAVLNALVHRDYSIHTEGVPIRIEMYRDRLEIKNSGGLYGKINIDSLGKVRPETRNAALANILEILDITENRYSGIPTIRSEFENAGLPEPVFSVCHGEFVVVLRNNIYKTDSSFLAKDMPKALIDFCLTPRSRTELVDFMGFSRYYTMSKIVQPLIDEGLLKLTMPDKPKSSKQRYVKA